MRAWWLPLVLLAGCGDSAVAEAPSGTTEASDTASGPASTTSSDPQGTSSSSGDAMDTSSSGGGSSTGQPLEGPGCDATVQCDGAVVEGDVRVASAGELDALAGVVEIEGTLEIAASELVCLDTLACLRVVGGDVRISNNPSLRSTAGLGLVETIGTGRFNPPRGSVIVADNPALEELAGFDGLRRIRYGLTLWRNDALRDVTGFDGLRRLGQLSVTHHASLEALSGLHDLEELSTCNVNLNPSLCISEVFEVCGDVQGDVQGVTNNNDDGC
ncbi:MAG: hypothetical protein ACE37F_22285 [Nannocystaceae bacterium]|nr:hypothetical protein [bacterium]